MCKKKKLGKEIRWLRERRGMTREVFCQNGDYLSVRQLARIESGISYPTVSKLFYIVNRLRIPLHYLIKGAYQDLPRSYLKIKFFLLRESSYNNQSLMEEKQVVLDRVYRDFYQELPNQECQVMDTFQGLLAIYLNQDVEPAKRVLTVFLSKIKEKESHSMNELFILELYFSCLFFEKDSQENFSSLAKKLIAQGDQSMGLELYFLIRSLLVAANVLLVYKDYQEFIRAIKMLKQLMRKSANFQYKPLLDLLEAKYASCVVNDTELAQKKYQQAYMGAMFVENDYLAEKIRFEKKRLCENLSKQEAFISILV